MTIDQYIAIRYFMQERISELLPMKYHLAHQIQLPPEHRLEPDKTTEDLRAELAAVESRINPLKDGLLAFEKLYEKYQHHESTSIQKGL